MQSAQLQLAQSFAVIAKVIESEPHTRLGHVQCATSGTAVSTRTRTWCNVGREEEIIMATRSTSVLDV